MSGFRGVLNPWPGADLAPLNSTIHPSCWFHSAFTQTSLEHTCVLPELPYEDKKQLINCNILIFLFQTSIDHPPQDTRKESKPAVSLLSNKTLCLSPLGWRGLHLSSPHPVACSTSRICHNPSPSPALCHWIFQMQQFRMIWSILPIGTPHPWGTCTNK